MSVSFAAPHHPTPASEARSRIPAHDKAPREEVPGANEAVGRSGTEDTDDQRHRRSGKARLTVALLAVIAVTAASRRDPGGTRGGRVAWRLEQPLPPEPPVGVAPATTPIGLGSVGDVEFWAPNRGVLITQGNGSTIPSGVWAYNGLGWRELSTECGATDGRITWAGPDEFWTISDGRPGTGRRSQNGRPRRLKTTRCAISRTAKSSASYGSPAFQANSYQPMHALGCISPSDCWFAGDALPTTAGRRSLPFALERRLADRGTEPARTHRAGHAPFEGRLLESVRSRRRGPRRRIRDAAAVSTARDQPGGRLAAVRTGARSALSTRAGEFPEALGLPAPGRRRRRTVGGRRARTRTPRTAPPPRALTGRTLRRRANGPPCSGPKDPRPARSTKTSSTRSPPSRDRMAHGWRSDSQDDAQKPSPTASAPVAHIDRPKASGNADAPLRRGSGRRHRAQGRGQEDHLPGVRGLLAGDEPGLALSSGAGRRTDGARWTATTRLLEPDHIPSAGRRRAEDRARRSAAGHLR